MRAWLERDWGLGGAVRRDSLHAHGALGLLCCLWAGRRLGVMPASVPRCKPEFLVCQPDASLLVSHSVWRCISWALAGDLSALLGSSLADIC